MELAPSRLRGVLAAGAFGLVAAGWALYAARGGSGPFGEGHASVTEPARAAEAPADALADGTSHAELERHLQRHPNDARALVLIARLDMQAQRFEPAAAAYDKALKLSTKVARDPAVWVEYAEARGMLQGGTLVGQPEQLVARALSLDAYQPQALDLAGSAAWERRDFVSASMYWKRLLAQLAPQSDRHSELSAAIERADQRARFALPPARP
jgi:cytochrome c-type biogenesis protein CcmH